MSSKFEYSIRSACLNDLKEVQAIQAYYVTETIVNFSYEPDSLEQIKETYEKVIKDGYDFLVAMQNQTNTLLGYAYVHPFRTRAGYQFTAELSIFCHPDFTNQGIGGKLLESILKNLRVAKQEGVCKHIQTQTRKDNHTVAASSGKDIHQLIATMAVSPNKEEDDKLKPFYERYGFVETALLKEVGWKQGRWLDSRYLQLRI